MASKSTMMPPAASLVNNRLANKNAKYMLDKEDVPDNNPVSEDFFE